MIDTNIIISLAVFNSEIMKNLINNISDSHKLVLCSYIIDELNEVLDKKFPDKHRAVDNFLLKIPYELEYTPKNIPNIEEIKLRDKKDKPIIYSAITSNVDIIITGDKDFDSIDIEKPEVMNASEFLDKY